VIQGSKGPTKETLAKALLIGAPLRQDKAFLAAEATLKPGAALAVVARGLSREFSERFTQQFGTPVRGFTITVHATDAVTGHIALDVVDAPTAKALVEKMRPRLEELRQLLERYDMRFDGPMVVIDFVITGAQIKTIVDAVKGIAGD